MSDDGAHLGVKPERALGTILGGQGQPSEQERFDPVAFEQWIMDAPEPAPTYNDAGRLAAKLVLTFFRRHPEHAMAPADSEFNFPPNFDWDTPRAEWPLVREGVYKLIERLEPDIFRRIDAIDLTGFLWGYGVNAARRCLELPPTANPAIVTLP